MFRPRRQSTVRFRESLVHERRDDEEQRTLLSQADLRAESVIQADAAMICAIAPKRRSAFDQLMRVQFRLNH